jgi:hypothetical protein
MDEDKGLAMPSGPGLAGPEECWLPVVGYQGLYEVSCLGRVKSLRRREALIMSPVPDSDGYPTVQLADGRGGSVRFKVHRLVCTAFHGPPPAGHEVAHLDGSKTNAAAANLKWCTPAENHAHKRLHGTTQSGDASPRAMMPEALVRQILKLKADGQSERAIAAQVGVEKTTVHRVLTGQTRAARAVLATLETAHG